MRLWGEWREKKNGMMEREERGSKKRKGVGGFGEHYGPLLYPLDP